MFSLKHLYIQKKLNYIANNSKLTIPRTPQRNIKAASVRISHKSDIILERKNMTQSVRTRYLLTYYRIRAGHKRLIY